jgi:hypothetical protein
VQPQVVQAEAVLLIKMLYLLAQAEAVLGVSVLMAA